MMIIQLIVGAICGAIAALIASSKGRNAVGWFFAGFFIGLIGIIIVACMPNLKRQRAMQAASERERRLLREQLRQERRKGEVFRQYSMGRLDAHDKELGVDTRSFQNALPGEDSALALEAMMQKKPSPDAAGAGPAHQTFAAGPAGVAVLWYYESAGTTCGPISADQIKQFLRSGKISPTTLLWSENVSAWTPAHDIPAFRNLVT